MTDLKIDYVELSSTQIVESKRFFAEAFGWEFVDYGPQYQAFSNAGIDGGIDGSGEGVAGQPLVILKASDLGATQDRIIAAGGVVTRAVYSFPGGRRFHFREPGGNELAVWSES